MRKSKLNGRHHPVLTAALDYAERDWHVFPVPPGTKKSYKSAEHSDGVKWGMTTDAAQIRADWQHWPKAGVGIATGELSHIFVLEIDTKAGHDVDGAAALHALEQQHDTLPPTLQARSPSGSIHYYFKHPGHGIKIKNSASELGPGIDVRGDGGMVVAPPTRRKDGVYCWQCDQDIAEAPPWLLDLTTQRSRSERANGHDDHNDKPATMEQIEAAVAAIPNPNLGWEEWNRIGMAIWAATRGNATGLALFDTFSQRSNKYNADKTRERWDAITGCPPDQLTVGTLFYLADRADPLWYTGATGNQASREEPAVVGGLGEWDVGEVDDAAVEPRGWLLGNVFCRGFVSSLFGSGGTGKSALRYAQLVSLAVERSLTGEHVFQRCRVLLLSFEDDDRELLRRLRAVRLHHNVERDELKGWLFAKALGRDAGKLLTIGERGELKVGKLAAKLEHVIRTRMIDLVSLDPFIKTHAANENDNNAMDAVAQILTDLAARYNIAVDLPHHLAKGAHDPGNANRGRGASAIKDAFRLVYTLTPMTPEEAKAFELDPELRRRLVRVDSGKVNIAPPMTRAQWFQLVSVPLGNATERYPNGDMVQTVEPWIPPETWADLSNDTLAQIRAAIDSGLPGGHYYTDAAKTTERAAWRVVQRFAPGKSEAQCREIIRTWVNNGVLEYFKYKSPTHRTTTRGLRVVGSNPKEETDP
jgi:hypothetical protein